jgi:uncharacterized damage-inducible protein DinB
MKMSETLLPEFDHEYANTRRTLERVPNDKLSWQPHVKSWPFQKLATHLAQLPTWVTETLRSDHVDLAIPTEQPKPATTAEIVALFDKNVAEARAALAGASDEEFSKPWSLRNGEQVLFTMPKIATLRGFVFNHQIHHRGQLTIYLRLNDIPVPALYGPSADESGM